jgi:golgi-specific brefeldin A-resistance guanine nucleotide exchange factor 1
MWMEAARARTAEMLHQRKRMKKRLSLAAERFNSDQKGWLVYAQELGLLPQPVTAAAAARFLKTTMGVDKAVLGEYMSKGPVDKYPFNAEVLREYTRLFDFKDTVSEIDSHAYLAYSV